MPTDETDTAAEADEAQEAPGSALAATASSEIEVARAERRELLMSRLVLPFAIPVVMGLAAVIFVINLASLFLGSKDPGNIVLAAGVTVLILTSASLISAAPRMRTSSLAMILVVAFMVVLSGGLTVYGQAWTRESTAPAGYRPPAGASTATFTVDAEASLTFSFPGGTTVAAGVIEVDYGGASGHTLVFDTTDPNLSKFELATPSPSKGKVELKAGTYTIYCSIPGHRAAGMEAQITVQ